LTLPNRSRAPLLLAAALGVGALFLALNHTAFQGFFQDDELDNISWAPFAGVKTFVVGLIDPRFQNNNFRPVGHWYFAVMGAHFGLNFSPYMTPIIGIHLLNAVLLYLLMRKFAVKEWCALAAAAFFTLSASAFDAYWKPMYVFDLHCTTFSLASILLYASRRWVLSFVAFWLAYKAKELAVMLPAVLALYEYWFGARKFKVLIPFFVTSLSFGIQGVLLNPNKDNDYTFRFTMQSLLKTVPFYAQRFLLFPASGLALAALALLRDRRIWFALSAMLLVMLPLLFLPGRLFEAYTYLPLAFAAMAMAAAASRVNPAWAWVLLALWMPVNIRQLRHERRTTLDRDRMVRAFVQDLGEFVTLYPDVRTLVYEGVPTGFHSWGVSAAWSILHHQLDMPAFWFDWPEGRRLTASQTVAYGKWDAATERLNVSVREPAPR
jgi:hypothetical protein